MDFLEQLKLDKNTQSCDNEVLLQCEINAKLME